MSVKKKSIKSDLKCLDKMTDQDIDYSDIPELDDSFFSRMTVETPHVKESVTLRLDHDVLEWFKKKGKGYQTRINAVLKAYMKAHT
ncbi:MAG: BrnA antitoxin family protein [Gammaproteobacteria bacterium]|jgi:uncharacterized protein (DUF4415 family)